MFSYACPFCAQRLLAPPERAGQRTICPKCLRPLTIPTPHEPAAGSDPQVHLTPAPGPTTPAVETLPAGLATGTTPPPTDTLGRNRPLPTPAARRPGHIASLGRDSGMVVLYPTGLAAVDIGAELTANLTLRMAPPPDPPADLTLTTCGWLTICAVAAVLWVGGVVSDPELLPFLGLLGVVTLAFGYLWAAYLAGRRNWVRGAVTLVPPVTLWRVCRPFGDNGYRPLRFVVTGALVFGLYWLGDEARAVVQPAIAALDPDRPMRADTSLTESVAARLAAAGSPDAALNCLLDLTAPEYQKAVPATDRPAVTAEIVRLTRPDGPTRPDVRAQAVRTLAVWSPADARPVVLACLASADSRERRIGLELAPRWPDLAIASAVAARLRDPGEEAVAREVLLQMPSAAESVLIPLLAGTDPMHVLGVTELLGKIGGPAAATALVELSETAADPAIRAEAARAAAAQKSRAR